MNNNTLLPIKDVLLQAWHKVKGVKGKIWSQVFLGSTFGLINALLISIRQARQEPIDYDPSKIRYERLGSFSTNPSIFVAVSLTGLPSLIVAGLAVLIWYLTPYLAPYLPSTFSSSDYILMFSGAAVVLILLAFLHIIIMYTLPNIFRKNISPWEAACQSYQLTKGHLCKIFLILLTQFIIIGLILAIPLAVILIPGFSFTDFYINGLVFGMIGWGAFTWIWIHPSLFMVYGEIYHRLTKATRTNIE